MADGPRDFCDPKVTTHTKDADGDGIGKWIAITVGTLLLLLLLGWLLGWFADDDIDATLVPAENGATTIVPADNPPVVIQ